MNPIDFIFQLLGDRLRISKENLETLNQRANDSYENSAVKVFFEKHWYIPIILLVAIPIVKPMLDRWFDSFGDQDQDGDSDFIDVVMYLLQNKDKLSSVKAALGHG